MDISLTVNGRVIARSIEDDRMLCDFLRDDLALFGTKVGCREGVCGTCTVLLDGRPVRSCLVLVAQADGSRVETVEGLESEGVLHPLQQAFVDHGALQCGFCTAGILMSAVVLLRDHPAPDRATIADALAGNLCRCTGYTKVVEAVAAVADGPA